MAPAVAVDAERLRLYGGAHALGDSGGDDERRVRHHDDEFLAAEPADEIGAAHDAAHALGEMLQHLVAGVMAVGVVDRFEMVDVEHHQRQRAALMRGLVEQSGEMRLEIAPIVEAGQRIDGGELDRRLQIGAQAVGVALAAQLAAHAGDQLVAVDRAARYSRSRRDRGRARMRLRSSRSAMTRMRQRARALQRAHLAAQAQRVEFGEVEADRRP